MPSKRLLKWTRGFHRHPGVTVRGSETTEFILAPLLKRAAEGDDEALTDLLTRLHVVVSRFIRRRMNYDVAAEPFIEDAAMETLVKIAENCGSCRGETDGEIVGWALAIARTVSVDLLRKGLLHYGAAAVCIDAGLSNEYESSGEASEATSLLLEIQQQVQDLLPEDIQRLLWLHLIEGASWADVGLEIGTTAAGAKRRYQRAQDRLRRMMVARIHKLPKNDRNLLLDYLARIGFDRI